MKPMLAYHSDPKVKAKYVARMKAHIKADELIAGIGWEQNGHSRGCAIGCTFNRYDHTLAPVEIGYPIQLAHLCDGLFEELSAHVSKKAAAQFADDFLSAPKTGADLSLVWSRFAVWMLVDEKDGVLFPEMAADVRKAVEGMATLFTREIAGDAPSEAEWSSAASAARAAWDARDARAAWAASAASAAWAAWDARDARDARAAWAAWAASAAWAAWDARDARDARAASAAWAASYKATAIKQAAKLIELLKSAPVTRKPAKKGRRAKHA